MKSSHQKQVAAVKLTGQIAKFYDAQGNNICSIHAPRALSANASGSTASITFPNRVVKLYKNNGGHLKNL